MNKLKMNQLSLLSRKTN